MASNILNTSWVKGLIVILSGVFVTAIFFRIQLLSHGTLEFGDTWDGLIAFSIIQHWDNVFHGIEHWRDMGYFYPYLNTLSYNDGYFLYGVIYSIIRLFKVKMLIALELTNVTIRMIGFYSFFYLCYKQLNLKFLVCLLTATIFSLSTALYVQSVHTQLFSVALAPLLTVFLINYFRKLLVIQDTYQAIFWGSMAGILYAAWLLSAYYMAWFYTLFACFWLLCLVILQYKHKRLVISRPAWIAVFIPVGVTILALIPFLMVYLPAALQTGMHGYGEALGFTPSIWNLINIGDQNLLWGKLLSYFHFPGEEFVVGYPLVFLAVLIAAIVSSMKDDRREVIILYRPIAYAIIISILVSIVIFKVSLWHIIWKLFPGAKGLRVVCRYWIYLVFPMSVLLTYYLSKKTVWSCGLMYGLIPSLLILEQINTGLGPNLHRGTEQAFIDSIKPIPAQCQVFFVTGTRHKEIAVKALSHILNNIDAMVIAEVIGAKTVNGTSTFVPPDWNFRYFPQDNYLDRIQIYAKKHNIKNLCSFDLSVMKWQD